MAHVTDLVRAFHEQGFSRGAYQVRVISAMIEKVRYQYDTAWKLDTGLNCLISINIQVGLIHKGNEDQIPLYALVLPLLLRNHSNAVNSAYELYASSPDSEAPNKRQETLNIDASANVGEPTSHEKKCKRFKKTFAREVMIHFVGAW